MGWRPLSGGIAGLWVQTIGAIVSSDTENRYSLKMRLVEAVVGWEGHRELSRVMFGSRVVVGGVDGGNRVSIVGKKFAAFSE